MMVILILYYFSHTPFHEWLYINGQNKLNNISHTIFLHVRMLLFCHLNMNIHSLSRCLLNYCVVSYITVLVSNITMLILVTYLSFSGSNGKVKGGNMQRLQEASERKR